MCKHLSTQEKPEAITMPDHKQFHSPRATQVVRFLPCSFSRRPADSANCSPLGAVSSEGLQSSLNTQKGQPLKFWLHFNSTLVILTQPMQSNWISHLAIPVVMSSMFPSPSFIRTNHGCMMQTSIPSVLCE